MGEKHVKGGTYTQKEHLEEQDYDHPTTVRAKLARYRAPRSNSRFYKGMRDSLRVYPQAPKAERDKIRRVMVDMPVEVLMLLEKIRVACVSEEYTVRLRSLNNRLFYPSIYTLCALAIERFVLEAHPHAFPEEPPLDFRGVDKDNAW